MSESSVITYRARVEAPKPKRHQRDYSDSEDRKICAMFAGGSTWSEIAVALNRRPQGVRARAYVLGLKRAMPCASQPNSPSRLTVRNRKFRSAYPEKWKAHKAVEWAVLSGTLVKEPCQSCGAAKVQAHHDDYARPLDVRWLCSPCHKAVHLKCA